jgi:hypothetical protein
MLKRVTWIFVALLAAPLVCVAAPAGQDYAARVAQVLKKTPLTDSHNDLPWEIASASTARVSSINPQR